MAGVAILDNIMPPHYEGLCVKVGGENGILLNTLIYLDLWLVGLHSYPGPANFRDS